MSEAPLGSGASDRAASLAAAGVILLAGALLAASLASVEHRADVDEGHYLAYMTAVERAGIGGFRGFFRDYLGDESRWRFPNPLRMSYIAASGLWAEVRGANLAALSELSLLSTLLSLGATYFFARCLLGNPVALMGTALLAFSPLWLALARRALVDSFATLWAVLAIWTFLEVLRNPARWGRRLAFSGVFAVALLAKESNALLAVPFALVLAVERYQRGNQWPLVPFGAALAIPFAAAGLLWLAAAGGPRTLLGVVEIILRSPETNVYANLYGRGPWTRYPIDLLLLSPVPTLLGFAGLALVGFRSLERRADPTLAHLALIAIGVLFAYDFFTKNVRYVAVVELPLRMLAAASLGEILRIHRTPLALAGCTLVVIFLCGLDYRSFQLIFVAHGLYDPVSSPLLVIRGLIPAQ